MFNFFKKGSKTKNTAALAKERLQIIVAHERSKGSMHSPDFIGDLQKDILEVVRKYVSIDDNKVKVAFKDEDGSLATLELNIDLSEED